MDKATYMVAGLFGVMVICSLIAGSIFFGDGFALKLAISAGICDYVVQVLDHFKQAGIAFDDRIGMFILAFWAWSVIFASIAFLRIIAA